jgi:hypothetical protein
MNKNGLKYFLNTLVLGAGSQQDKERMKTRMGKKGK